MSEIDDVVGENEEDEEVLDMVSIYYLFFYVELYLM
jgi:hypothetical protein